ncbi:MAG TPA: hypothetical protein VJ719_04350 [Chthoniobacterales bacterium]|nr:hypothetical protein [Chthoniobacterales bacterium]
MNSKNAGSALVTTILTVALLCLIGGTLLSLTSSKQSGPFQAASWHEAGSAAEGGVEIALNALRRSITEGNAAWDGWTLNTSSPTPTPSASPSASPSPTPFAKKYITESELLSHQGEGNKTVRAIVEISIPTGLNTINPSSIPPNRYAYLIRSTGYANIPVGARRLPQNKADLALRKLNLFRDFRTGAAVNIDGGYGQVSRVVEAIATPVTPFPAAILSKDTIEIKSGSGMIVDSYDPTVTPYKYDASKAFGDVSNPGAHRQNGNIATNAKKKNNGDVVRLENVKVYGLVAKGEGVVNIKTANASVSGEIIDGFYRELKPVQSPRNNTSFSTPTSLSLNRPKGTVNVNAGSAAGSSLYYKTDKIHLHDKDVLKIKKNGSGGGTAEIWVTGDVVIHNGGRIEVENGANVVFYFEKNLTLQEKDANKPAVKNEAVYATGGFTDPTAVQFYGVVPDRKKKQVKVKTNFSGLIYAPDHEFEEIKLKSGRHIYGSLAGRKFKIEGNTQIHYDESLQDFGKPFDYTLESWQEDWFDPNVRTASTP